MMATQAPWIGLESIARFDKSVYSPQDSVRVEAVVRNPTDSMRVAYFNSSSLFRVRGSYGFHLWESRTDPWQCVAGIKIGYEDTCSALEYQLAPGDSLVYVALLPLSGLTYNSGDNSVEVSIISATSGYRFSTPDTFVVVRN